MPNTLTDITTSMTVAQMQAATKAQIVDDVTTKMSKRDLIIALTGTDKMSDAPALVYRKEDGQIESQTEIIRDVETGAVIGGKQITYTYYKGGEVDEITIIETDDRGKETSRKIIKHFDDGQQPEVMK